MSTDSLYQDMLYEVLTRGDRITTRNHACYSLCSAPSLMIDSTPLITWRKTAWKKALREMEWFLSGDDQCPDELLAWWDGQLNPADCYKHGYSYQFRLTIERLIEGIIRHPNSRRHCLTTWDFLTPKIAEINCNPNTPATCHGSFIQCFVRNGKLHMTHYQRSADILLGLPHNLCQYWALLLWLSAQTRLQPGILTWHFGDLHLYDDPSHVDAAKEIILSRPRECTAELIYTGKEVSAFKAGDFELHGDIPEPVWTGRPKLF